MRSNEFRFRCTPAALAAAILACCLSFCAAQTRSGTAPADSDMPGWSDAAVQTAAPKAAAEGPAAPAAPLDETREIPHVRSPAPGTGAAHAADTRTAAPTVGWARMLGYLLLVLALIVAVAWLMHRLRLAGGGASAGSGRLLVRMTLGPRQSLVLVKFLNRLYVLAVTPSQITPVECIDSPEIMARMEGLAAGAEKGSVQGLFESLLRRQGDAFDPADADDDADDEDGPDGPVVPRSQGDAPDEMDEARGEVKKLLKKIKGLSKIHFHIDSF